MKHTKGPWDVVVRSTEKGISGYVGANNSTEVLATVECPNEQGMSNAQLIAAAPEMLEALEEFLRCGPNAGHNRDLLELIESVIKKARGES